MTARLTPDDLAAIVARADERLGQWSFVPSESRADVRSLLAEVAALKAERDEWRRAAELLCDNTDLIVALPGVTDTADMLRRAQEAGVRVSDVLPDEPAKEKP